MRISDNVKLRTQVRRALCYGILLANNPLLEELSEVAFEHGPKAIEEYIDRKFAKVSPTFLTGDNVKYWIGCKPTKLTKNILNRGLYYEHE